MNRLFKMLGFLAVMLVAALAGPASAGSPEKIFTLTMSPASVAAGATASFTATFRNATPSGNSSINSLILTAPAGVTITAVSAPPSGSASIGTGGASVSVSNMSPVKPGQTFVVTLSATIPASPGCTSYAWSAQSWTGSSFSGDTFRLLPPPQSSLTTNVASSCQLRFVPGKTPQAALTNAVITSVAGNPAGAPVQVELIDGSTRVTTFTGTVTLTKTPASSSGAASGAAVAAVAGLATFPSLSINATGTYALVAGSPGVLSSAPSPSFTIYGGDIFCGDDVSSTFANPDTLADTAPGYAAGMRGKYNKNGSTCIKVDYTFTNDILANNVVHLAWDTNVQPYASFAYTMNWRLMSVDADGWTAIRPDVAWEADGSGNPIYVPGLACLAPSLPAPYGTLGANIATADPSVVVNTTAPIPAAPFAIVVGTERMQVTSVTGAASPYTLAVNRGQGGTTAASHSSGDSVMSTPLPIVPASYALYAGQQARMCIVDHGFTAAGTDASGNALVMYSTTVFDIGDGWVRIQ